MSDLKILILGDTSSGKTRLLYQMKLGADVMTIPTNAFNVESIQLGCNELTFWDVGGAKRGESDLNDYYPNTNLILYCVDLTRDVDSQLELIPEYVQLSLFQPPLALPKILLVGTKGNDPNAKPIDDLKQATKSFFAKNKDYSYEVFPHTIKPISAEGAKETLFRLRCKMHVMCNAKISISTSFFWTIMTHPVAKVCGQLLLVAGLLAMGIGVVSLGSVSTGLLATKAGGTLTAAIAKYTLYAGIAGTITGGLHTFFSERLDKTPNEERVFLPGCNS